MSKEGYYWQRKFDCGCFEYMKSECDMLHIEFCEKHQAKIDDAVQSEKCPHCGREYFTGYTTTKNRKTQQRSIRIVTAKSKVASHLNYIKYTIAITDLSRGR